MICTCSLTGVHRMLKERSTMGFDEVLGQRVIVESLRNAVKNNMAANGYIFSGPKGCGKSLIAFNFAMALNCTGAAGLRPCGSCSSCIRIKSGNHPNVEVVKPAGLSIKIKQIREIISEASKKPFESGYKIIIVESAEKMTSEAQDAFLKTLEEPPLNTVFILLAENHGLLLPTIVSRCQVYKLKPVDINEMKKFIAARYDYKPEDIESAVRHSNGVPGKALELLKNKENRKERLEYINILEKALAGDRVEALLMAATVIEAKEEAEKFLDFSMTWFRDVMILRESQRIGEQLIINIDYLDRLVEHNSLLTGDRLNSIMEIIKNTMKYVKHNMSIKNSIDGMLLNIAEVGLYNGKNSWGTV